MDSAQRKQELQIKKLQLQLQQLELQIQIQQEEEQNSGQKLDPESETKSQQEQQGTQGQSEQQGQQETQGQSEQQGQQETQGQSEQQGQQGTQGQSEQLEQPDQKQKKKGLGKQPPRYLEPPKMVSTIDIGYLKNMMSSNLLAVKQYRQAAQNCQLPDLKRQFVEAGQMHLRHYDSLLKFLSENGGNMQ